MKYSIVIATFNRAGDLRETLKSLARLTPDGPWEVIVVDNNSSDDTRAVVEEASTFVPGRAEVPLRGPAGPEPRTQFRDSGGPRRHHCDD